MQGLCPHLSTPVGKCSDGSMPGTPIFGNSDCILSAGDVDMVSFLGMAACGEQTSKQTAVLPIAERILFSTNHCREMALLFLYLKKSWTALNFQELIV